MVMLISRMMEMLQRTRNENERRRTVDSKNEQFRIIKTKKRLETD